METDYLIVGSGLTGAVMARLLHERGFRVLVVERRQHLGGNVHDSTHASGIRIHTYGPHYFRTSSERLWEFVRRFSDFYHYAAVVKTVVDGRIENWPLNRETVARYAGEGWTPEFKGEATNFEEAMLAQLPRPVYDRFVCGYTTKQWSVDPRTLSADLAKRVELRANGDTRFMRHRFQGLPTAGYAAFMEKLLENIPVILNCNYLASRDELTAKHAVIYTGPIDEYYDFDLGKLAYRGQAREHRYLPNVDRALPAAQLNNPGLDNGAHLRTLEWKQMMPDLYAERIKGTVLTTETPIAATNPQHYEYPAPDAGNRRLYESYAARAGNDARLLFCGRLGEYRYLDMDQAIARAMVQVERLLARTKLDDAMRQVAEVTNEIRAVAEVPGTEQEIETRDQ